MGTVEMQNDAGRAFQSVLRALTCPLCNRLFDKPYTAPQCGHTFCWDCVCNCLEGPGICRSDCPSCHLPLWKKDLAADDQIQRLILRITSVLPTLARAGDVSHPLNECAPMAPGGPSSIVAIQPSTTPDVMLPVDISSAGPSRKRSGTPQQLTSAGKAAKKRARPTAVVQEAHELAQVQSAAAHVTDPLLLPRVCDPVPKQGDVHTVPQPVAVALQHDLRDPAQWDKEPDWLAAQDPTQRFATQFDPTQPCCFEALLATKSATPLQSAATMQPPCKPLSAPQPDVSQPHTASHFVTGESSEISAGEALPKSFVRTRETDLTGQPAATPVLMRRRHRSGAGAQSEPAMDRSNNPLLSSTVLSSKLSERPDASVVNGFVNTPLSPARGLQGVFDTAVGVASPVRSGAVQSGSDATATLPSLGDVLQKPRANDASGRRTGSAASAKAPKGGPGYPIADPPPGPPSHGAALEGAVRVQHDEHACSVKDGVRSPAAGEEAVAAKLPTRRRRAKGRRRAGGGAPTPMAVTVALAPYNAHPEAGSMPECQVADDSRAGDENWMPGRTGACDGELHEAAEGKVASEGLVGAADAVGSSKLQGPSGEGGDVVEGKGQQLGGSVPGDACHAVCAAVRVDGEACGRAHRCDAAEQDMLHSSEAVMAPRARRRRRRAKTHADPAFDTVLVEGSPAIDLRRDPPGGATGACAREHSATVQVPEEVSVRALHEDVDSVAAGNSLAAPSPSGQDVLLQPGGLPAALPVEDGSRLADRQGDCDKENASLRAGQVCGAGADVQDRMVQLPGSPTRVECKGGMDVASRIDGPSVSDAAVHISQPRFDRCSQGEHARAGGHAASVREVHDSPWHDVGRPSPDAAGRCDAGDSPAGHDADLGSDVCATPVQHPASGMLGPGFISASELLESQRSGAAHSSAAARSPRWDTIAEPAAPCAAAAAAEMVEHVAGVQDAAMPWSAVDCDVAVLHPGPGVSGDGGGSVDAHPQQLPRCDTDSNAATASAVAAHGEDLCNGAGIQTGVVQGDGVLQATEQEPARAPAGSVDAGFTGTPEEPHNCAATERAAPQAVDFSQLSDWANLTGPQAGEFMGHWSAVLRGLPKPMPKEVAAALHAELRGMLRAHGTLSRIVQKLQGTCPPRPAVVTASQQPEGPGGQGQSKVAMQEQNTSVGAGSMPPAQRSQRATAAEPQNTHSILLPTLCMPEANAPEAGTQDMLKSAQMLSQQLRHTSSDVCGWTADISQPQRHCGAALKAENAAKLAAQVPRTPVRHKAVNKTVASPPCIPDTPSESEGGPGSQSGRNRIVGWTQEPHGSPADCPRAGGTQTSPEPTGQADVEQPLLGYDQAVGKQENMSSETRNVAGSQGHAAPAVSGTDTVVLHGFQLVGPRRKGRLSRKPKAV